MPTRYIRWEQMPPQLAVLLRNMMVAGTEEAYTDAALELQEWLDDSMAPCLAHPCGKPAMLGSVYCEEHLRCR